jgi:hypothetical protein
VKFQGVLAKPSDFIGNILKAGGHQNRIGPKNLFCLGFVCAKQRRAGKFQVLFGQPVREESPRKRGFGFLQYFFTKKF